MLNNCRIWYFFESWAVLWHWGAVPNWAWWAFGWFRCLQNENNFRDFFLHLILLENLFLLQENVYLVASVALIGHYCCQTLDDMAEVSIIFNDSIFNFACRHICPSLSTDGSCCRWRTASSALCMDSSSARWKQSRPLWTARRPNTASPACNSKWIVPKHRDSAANWNSDFIYLLSLAQTLADDSLTGRNHTEYRQQFFAQINFRSQFWLGHFLQTVRILRANQLGQCEFHVADEKVRRRQPFGIMLNVSGMRIRDWELSKYGWRLRKYTFDIEVHHLCPKHSGHDWLSAE